MSLAMDDCIRLKAAGYTEHEIAQIAKVPTPAIVGLARYGKQPSFPIEGVNVEELLKSAKPKQEPPKVEDSKEVAESTGQSQEKEEKRGVKPPKNEGQ